MGSTAGRIVGVESFHYQAGLVHPGPRLCKSGAVKEIPLVEDGPSILPVMWRDDLRATSAFLDVGVAYHA